MSTILILYIPDFGCFQNYHLVLLWSSHNTLQESMTSSLAVLMVPCISSTPVSASVYTLAYAKYLSTTKPRVAQDLWILIVQNTTNQFYEQQQYYWLLWSLLDFPTSSFRYCCLWLSERQFNNTCVSEVVDAVLEESVALSLLDLS